MIYDDIDFVKPASHGSVPFLRNRKPVGVPPLGTREAISKL
jgi:hypothetical protein